MKCLLLWLELLTDSPCKFCKTCISAKYRAIHLGSSMCGEYAKYTMWHIQILTLGLQKCDPAKNQNFVQASGLAMRSICCSGGVFFCAQCLCGKINVQLVGDVAQPYEQDILLSRCSLNFCYICYMSGWAVLCFEYPARFQRRVRMKNSMLQCAIVRVSCWYKTAIARKE